MEEKFTKKHFDQLKNRKSIKGHSESDVANSSIRKILSQLSKKFPAVDEDYFKNCLEFFDYKCPYTNEKLSIENNELDHIIPQNRKYCGLNVKGNIIICTPDANREKGSLTASDFLLGKTKKSEQFWKKKGSTLKERKVRLEKLKEFQNEYNYGYDEIRDELYHLLDLEYKKIQDELKQKADEKANEYYEKIKHLIK